MASGGGQNEVARRENGEVDGLAGNLCMLKKRMKNMPFVGGAGSWQGVDQRAVLFGKVRGQNGKVVLRGLYKCGRHWPVLLLKVNHYLKLIIKNNCLQGIL